MAHHTKRGSAPSRLAAGLMRAAVALFAASGLFAATAVHEASASPCGVAAEGTRPIPCDVFTKLDLDLLNDDIEPPECWSVNAIGVPAGQQVAFKIYGLTENASFYQEVTSEVKYLRFKVHGFHWHPRFR